MFEDMKNKIVKVVDNEGVLQAPFKSNNNTTARLFKTGDFYCIIKNENGIESGKALLTRLQFRNALDSLDLFQIKRVYKKRGNVIYLKEKT